MLQAGSQEYTHTRLYHFRLDAEGYLADPLDWSPAFSEQRARQAGITLTDKHWQLIYLVRDKFLKFHALPPMRSVCRAVGFDKHELKQEIGSCLVLWKIAGLPDPGEEAKSYMS